MTMSWPDASFFGPEAARDDDLAVLGQRLADSIERFLHGGVDEAAGVDDDEVGAIIRLGRLVAFRSQLGQDLLGIDQRLRATERNETDLGRVGRCAYREIGRRGIGRRGIGVGCGDGIAAKFMHGCGRRECWAILDCTRSGNDGKPEG